MNPGISRHPAYRSVFLGACLLALLSGRAGAQDPHTLWFHPLNARQGLSQSYNWYVYHDSEGFVWINSIYGLNRFDGYQVKVYSSDPADSTSLLEELIYSNFFEDKNKDIWFSTINAVHCYRRRQGNFSRFRLRDRTGKPIKTDYQVQYLEKDSLLWVSNSEAIYRFNTRKPEMPAERIANAGMLALRVLADRNGSVRKLYALGLNGVEIFTVAESPPRHDDGIPLKGKRYFQGIRVRELWPENDTTVWMCTDRHGLISWNPAKPNSYKTFGDFAGAPASLTPWGPGKLIVGVKGRGIFIVRKKDGAIRPLNCRFIGDDNQALRGLKSLYLDRDENLWISDENNGVHYANLRKTKFLSFPSPPSGTGNDTYSYWAFEEDAAGNTWAATSPAGIFLFDKNKRLIRQFTEQPGNPSALPSNTVRDLKRDQNGNIWMATLHGLAWTKPGTHTFNLVKTKDGNGDINFIHLHVTRDNRILATTEFDGVYEAREEGNNKVLVRILSNDHKYQTIFEDKAGQLYFFRDGSEAAVLSLQKQDLKELRTLPVSGFIYGFFEDECDKTYVFATANGLVKISQEDENPKKVVYTEKEGLPGTFIGEMAAGEGQNLWLGTNKGLALFDPSGGSIRSFTLADGAQSTEFQLGAVLKRSNGEIWFGGSDGITIVPASGRPKPIRNLPKVLITGIRINDLEPDSLSCEETGATNISEIRKLRLPFRKNTLSFNFIAIEYSDPSGNRLKYRLEGTDKNWLEVEKGKVGFARYPNLLFGNYTLWLQAANSDGVWGAPVPVLRITICAPWYLTWWFLSLVAITVISLAIYFVRKHVNRIRKEAERRRKEAEDKQQIAELRQRDAESKQQIAELRQREAEAKQMVAETETAILRLQMNPHFIFNSMNSIDAYIRKRDIEKASDYLGRFARLMRSILDLAAKPHIAISDEVQLLDQYLQTEAMRFEKTFSYSFDLDPAIDPDDIVVPTLILQPFVENAIWHGLMNKGGDGHITISFRKDAGGLICSVEDNGIGREAAQKMKNGKAGPHESKALAITKRRLELLKEETGSDAAFEVIDLRNEEGRALGTKVQLLLPILD